MSEIYENMERRSIFGDPIPRFREPSMTAAQARALERQKQAMKERDEKLVSIRLNGKTRARLDWLAKSYGSRQRVIEALVNGD